MKTASIVIADDHDLARSGIAAVLATSENLDIVGQAKNGLEAVELCDRLRPDLILLDIRMTPLDGLGAAAEIRKIAPDTKIVMLTMHESIDYLSAAIKVGASGYLLKDVSRESLLRTIDIVLDGQAFFDADLMRKMLARIDRESPAEMVIERLTNREREILCSLTTGETNKGIARALSISPGTVKVHVERILSKLGVTDRTQAAVLAIQAGLLRKNEL
ncbi:response regulator transcription factor [Agrobacterium rhizogenes]|uniref:Two-component response regulator n=1 Tax=Rhizobium rhizogenes NBRC 13257 TaxID=1220581 RepID=A0AA87U632_RHIRH|nr:response regulator transcription factor [Rhizobium rhizogenes]OCJ01719.1 DNA-binding response regulator [Agrobacterium sp. 13-626]OCJ19431.1 DNA-binding response regulator [Agrobacterium sp. B133/95]KEA08777.1 LuxR family transcriptional regulator [Rhizobium rhizogenes]MQB30688.1 DNA-binding response regulator [Rhizobium rhizogenes]NTF58831.1 response regulator transcription factor [Rhizobium rhizogenes]